MTGDDFTITHTEERPNGSVRVRGVTGAGHLFTVTIMADEYAVHGVWPAVRAYLDRPAYGKGSAR